MTDHRGENPRETELFESVSARMSVSSAQAAEERAATNATYAEAVASETEHVGAFEAAGQKEADDLAVAGGDSANAEIEALSLTFENHEAELIQAGDVVDEQGRSKGHRSFQVLGVFLLLWMFVPNILKDPGDLMSWLMVLAAVGLLWVVLKFPARINARFAKERAEAIPECTVEVSAGGMMVIEGPSRYEIDFGGKLAAYDYRDGITVQAENNRILCIPKKQLTEAELFSLRAALRRGLGDRFKTVDYNPQKSLFGGLGGRR